MAEVENGSPSQPVHMSTTSASPQPDDGSRVDASPHPQSPQSPQALEPTDNPVPSGESESPNGKSDQTEKLNVSTKETEPVDDPSPPSEQPPSPPKNGAVEPPQTEHVPTPESESKGSGPPNSEPEGQTPVEDKEPHSEQRPSAPTISITDEQAAESRMRSDSRSTTTTATTHKSVAVSSTVFIVTALDTIRNSKEARRDKTLEGAVQDALANVKQSEQRPIDPEVIFRPLHIATKSFSIPLQVTALDCIGKLITYSYFAFPSQRAGAVAAENQGASEQTPLIERAIDAICDCFENEATPVEIQQQIIKSLLAAVLNDKIVVHGAGLLKAVRQIYNIFIYSRSSQNQQVAQGSLTQMITTVFDRVRIRLELKELRLREGEKAPGSSSDVATADAGESSPSNNQDAVSDAPSSPTTEQTDQPDQPDQSAPREPAEKLTLQSFESPKEDPSVNESAPTMVTRAKTGRATSRSSAPDEKEEGEGSTEDDVDEIYIKDAFLVFRALCKLSHKVLSHDQQQDVRSQNMRSKLLSLHLIHYLINNQVEIFTSPLATIKHSSGSSGATTLLQAIRPHLCLSLSRNGSSSVQKVFEVCCELFWIMLKNMRVMVKKELEVFLKEIYLAILEKRNAPSFQKQYFMEVLERLSGDPRALVELYLNYDCDRTALENIYQNIIEQLSRYSSMPVAVTLAQEQQFQEHHIKASTVGSEWHHRGTLPPSLAFTNINTFSNPNTQNIPPEYILKCQAIECLVSLLRALDNWASQGLINQTATPSKPSFQKSLDMPRESIDTNSVVVPSPKAEGFEGGAVPEDDPSQIEKVKQKKIALVNAIQQFNFKPKRGIKMFLQEGFIRSSSPEDIAGFLLRNERLDKAMIGEYLGEGEPENIAIMHAFVDMMDFSKRRFVDSLRQFLQHFRLPGEAQKIDRFMLKFAERYVTHNPNAFANADTAYVLAYSVILLNTDQHSTKFKGRRMTKEDFIKNNRGINDNQDLPNEYLGSIYDDIANNEIVLITEREHAANIGVPTSPPPGLATRAGQVFATVGRDIQGEKYAQASEEMANKTEQLYRSLIRAQRKTAVREVLSRFIPANSSQHAGSMFNVTWMSFLSGLSAPVRDAQSLETIKECMNGVKLAIRISCSFDLETPRIAFVTALAKFTNLGNVSEMMPKNVEALKAILDVALLEGNNLKSSWREILTCVSQLDRLQLLSDGVDEGSLPDVSRARIIPPPGSDGSRKSVQTRRPRPRSIHTAPTFRPEVAIESRSAEMVRGVDRIFTNTANLSHEAIVDFVRELSGVSWQEIQSSGESDSPRTYSLQKLVEISYYNMTRVRIEWSKIWEILGQHFNRVGCHYNTVVVFFALDSLRQLSMRFMEIEELPGFKFQKDFLKPFEHIMTNSVTVTVKDMILRCLIQMIQARGNNIRSGWKTMFGVFTVAAREPYEGIVTMAFDHVSQIYSTRFGVVITQGAFADLIVCLTEFSKNIRFQKKSLQAIETLKSTVTKMLRTPECPLSHRHIGYPAGVPDEVTTNLTNQLSRQTQEEQFWYPVLIAFQDVLMTGDDLEVRSRALAYLFEIMIRYGGEFPPEFWDVLWRQLLYPIFVVLQSKSEMSKVPNHEELSVWLSTTMIQALRNMITLFTHYFSSLEYMLDRFLELLTLCICQENDTIARIGSNCLQQLILQNVTKFRQDHWTKIVGAFVELFSRTTAYELFTAAASMSSKPSGGQRTSNGRVANRGDSAEEDEAAPGLKVNGSQSSAPEHEDGDLPAAPAGESPATPNPQLEDYRPQADVQQQPPAAVTVARRRFFNRIITNCVLQLLMIETVHELFSNEMVYAQIPSHELLRLMGLLKKSYQFAKKFNEDKELRMQLWRQGFMKQPPNLLKQESGSAATYVHILFRMYHDEREERKSSRAETEAALIPLCADIIRSFVRLDEDSQHRNILAWRPVVVDVLEGYTNFTREGFDKHVGTFYTLAIELLGRDLKSEIRVALQALLRRIGETKLGISFDQEPVEPFYTSELRDSQQSFDSSIKH